MKDLEHQLRVLKSEVASRDATITSLESSLSLERSWKSSPSDSSADVTALTAKFESELASKDEVIKDLGKKISQNMTDYADLVRSSLLRHANLGVYFGKK